MNREIKFRAWDVELKVMFHVDTISFVQGGILIQDGATISTFNAILMQYTGLKDKNGVDIYEGDICQFNKVEDEPCFFYGLAFIDNKTVGGEWEIIKCDNIDSEIPDIKGEQCLDSSAFWNEDFEVIGNIHENPELI